MLSETPRQGLSESAPAESPQERTLRRLASLNQLQREIFVTGPLAEKLRKITDFALNSFDVDFCRIWLIGGSDLYSNGCIQATTLVGACRRKDACLNLIASSGRHTHLDEADSRIPLNHSLLGRIATGEEANLLTNEPTTDPRIHDHASVEELGLVSFAGYKLHDAHGNPTGVMAMFAKHPLTEEDDVFLSNLAETTSQVISESIAEEAILAGEEQYKAIYDASSDAILYCAPDGGVQAGNPAAIRLFGCKDEAEFHSLSLSDLSPEYQPDGSSSSTKLLEMTTSALKGGAISFEWTYQRRNGRCFPAMVQHAKIDLKGSPLILATVRDLTSQKESERSEQEAKRRLANIIEFLPDATFAIDRKGKVIAWNRAIEEMCRIPANEILGKGDYSYALPFYGKPAPSLADMVLNGDAEAAKRYSSFARKESQLIAELSTSDLRSGKSLHLSIIAAPLYDSDGCVVGAIESIRDVTDRKCAEERLRASEAKYRTLYDASQDAIMIRGLDMRLIAANPAAVELFRCKDETELLATKPEDLYPVYQPDRSLSATRIKELVANAIHSGLRSIEWRYQRKDGTLFDAVVSLQKMRIENEDVGLVTIRDVTRQKEAEQAMRASETKYRTLYDASSDAILLQTRDHRIAGANRAAVALFGCSTEDELRSLQPADIYAEYQPDGQLSAAKAPSMAEIALREGSHKFECKYRRRDGTEFLADVLWTKMELEGKPILLTTIRDITKQREAEEALRASERSYRLLTENNRDVIWAIDFTGRFIYLSPSVEQLLGYKTDETQNSSLEDFLTPESAEKARAHLAKAIEAAVAGQRVKGESIELDQIRKDGSIVPTEVSYSGMYDESGQLVAVQGLNRDITDRRLAEQEQTLATQRMESLLALSQIADRPMDEIVATVVEDAIRMTRSKIGYMALVNEDESVLTMQYWSHATHAGGKTRMTPIVYPIETTGLWGEAVRQRQPVVTNDYAAPNPLEIGTPEGHVPIVRHMNIPVFDGKRIVAVAGVGNKPTDYDERDLRQLQLLMSGWWRIVTQKQYELDLAQARDEAQAANRAKSQFLATMSHEIRTPMTAILGYADLLMDPSLDTTVRNNYAKTILRSGEHLLALINDILDLSKIESGKMTLAFERCHILSLLADVANLFRPRAVERNIAFSLEYTGAIPETIYTDSGRLRQAIINLTGNAIKFTEEGGVRIVVSFLPEGIEGQPAVQVDVVDTGIGISPENISRLFRPFSQGDASVTRKYGGTGLGLTISRHLTQMLGGDITVQSEFGRGSTFSLMIPTGSLQNVPMIETPDEVIREDAAKAWPVDLADLTGVRILLAEDGIDNRELIEAVLSRVGAKVEMAENGLIAVEKVQTQTFDLILMDMNMPVMDGYEAIRILRGRGCFVPIVALTANAMIGDSDKCRAAGANEYLAKPIDRRQLIETINYLVRPRLHTEESATPADARDSNRSASFQGPPYAGNEQACTLKAAEAPASSQETAVVDDNIITSDFITDPDMVPVIERFITRLPGQIDAMHRALRDCEYGELRQLAHKLKGAGGSYGFPQLTDACRVLESAASSQDHPAATAAMDEVMRLGRAITR